MKASPAVAAVVDMIKQCQDGAEELMISIDVYLMSIARSITSPKMAGQYSKEVKEFTRALTKCHVYLKRHDKENHTVDLGPRIEETLANLRELQLRLLRIQQEAPEELCVPASEAAPAGPPQADQKMGDSTRQAVTTITAKQKSNNFVFKLLKKGLFLARYVQAPVHCLLKVFLYSDCSVVDPELLIPDPDPTSEKFQNRIRIRTIFSNVFK